jgi:membrane-bound lytic murein transglycosylase D
MRLLIFIAASQLLAGSLAWAGAAELPELVLSQGDSLRASSRTTVAAMTQEANLGHALELPASEFFVQDEPEQVATDFELKLPEDELPESDIPLTLNSKVEYFINYFQHNGKGSFARWLSRSERFLPMMKQVLKKEGLPEDLVYLAMIESGFSPHAYSVASAVGPWQFMSGTGKRYALRIDPWIDERRDPLKSTVAAALYLKELYELFNKDWYLAAAGYNAGENKILRAIGMYNSRDFWQLSKGSYLKRETKDYVPKLLAAAIIAKEPARYGFADVAYLPPIEFDTLSIPFQTNLDLITKVCDVPAETLRNLNPELRRWATPPDYPNYELKIPKGKKAQCEAEYAKVPENERFTQKSIYARYKVKKKETLASVAQRFGTTTEVLAELNGIRKTARVRGKTLTVPMPQPAPEAAPAVADDKASTPKVEAKDLNKYYTVKKGDTLKSLAKRFNVSTRLLSAWNNIKGKVALRPGRRIIVAKYEADENS